YPLQQLNSVSFECLLSAGVADTCRQDDGFPYAATSALLDALLAAPSPSCQPSTLKNERDFIPSSDSGEASQYRSSLNIKLPFFF
ncbi:MAG: hypothetical protein Q8P67_13080, partial [archaeon]|nr:hypothetical protein [archaeon]